MLEILEEALNDDTLQKAEIKVVQGIQKTLEIF